MRGFNGGKWRIPLAQTNSGITGLSLKFQDAMSSLGITFTKDDVTGNDTNDRLDEIEAGIPIVTKTANYTVAVDDEIILGDSTSGDIVITLPSPSSAYDSTYLASRTYNISKIDSSSNTVTISPSVSETIAGDSSFVLLYQNEALTLVTDSINWFIKD